MPTPTYSLPELDSSPYPVLSVDQLYQKYEVGEVIGTYVRFTALIQTLHHYKRVQLLKEQTDLQKQQRKAAKKEALLKKRIRQEDPESLNVPCSDPLQETSSSSEYSDYDIDEFGNIIETIKPPKPIRESSSFIKQQEQALEQEQHLMTQVLGFQSFGSTRK
ncbi:hypothetical protein HMI55_001567 [Coelomomyces lativittatus]|nr:hypothetical protein HMI55_001567 [Coelomomyces lativittatus]